ncbi:MAG: serine/threonine-protein kinase [Kofleriaceae bacterium]
MRRRIGVGGMAEVFLGWDRLLERDVAVKVLRSDLMADPHQVERFMREGRFLAEVDSDHVVEIFDAHFGSEQCFLVLRYLVGRTLARVVEGAGPMSTETALLITRDVLQGLYDLHQRGLVHGDIKPANVVIDNDERAILLDLGISHDSRRPMSERDDHTAGTLPFMAPEQRAGDPVDARSDIYQVGMLLLFMTAGGLENRSRVPARVAGVVARALAPADQRYQTVNEMAEAVSTVMLKSETVDIHTSDLIEWHEAQRKDQFLVPDRNAATPVQISASMMQRRRDRLRWGRVAAAAVLVIAATLWLDSRITSTQAPRSELAPGPPIRLEVEPVMPVVRSTAPIESPPPAPAAPSWLPEPTEREQPPAVEPTPRFVRAAAPAPRAKSARNPLAIKLQGEDLSTEELLLVTALEHERNGAREAAIAAFRAYLRNNPDGRWARAIRARVTTLEHAAW